MMDMKHVVETRAEIRLACKGMTANERKYVKAMAFHFVDYLESVQRMPLVVRLKFYRVVFYLFNLLRKNGQLGRREGGFDPEVRKAIRNVLSEKLSSDDDDE